MHVCLLCLIIHFCFLFASFSGREVPDSASQVHRATFEKLKDNVQDTYFSNDELASFVLGMATACSDIMVAFEWGKSGSGIRLLAIDISDSAGTRCVPPDDSRAKKYSNSYFPECPSSTHVSSFSASFCMLLV